MKSNNLRMTMVLVLTAGLVCCQQQEEQKSESSETVVKYGVTVKKGPMDEVLVKDYAPGSSLVVPETKVPTARFPVIDTHTHVYARTPEEVKEWVETMDAVGIEITVVLTGAIGERFDKLVDLYLKPFPDRFQLYCGILTEDIEAPDYPEKAVQELVRCYQKGARGVGEVSDKGWGIGGSSSEPLPQEKRLHPDDSRLAPFWEKCAELKLPINLHIADHPSCWQPLGPNWERTPDFQGFNLYGKDVPSYEELLAARDRMLEKHPNTTYILCHLSNQGNDLGSLAEMLDRFPNAYLDVSARDYELGRQPRFAREFLERYRDRVVFGTDMGREQHMYEGWWRVLETADEFIPGRLWWRYYGLELSDDVMKALYQDTSREILNWEPIS
jgi:predicted TIM-barrel fold metal-dependent hydrolase